MGEPFAAFGPVDQIGLPSAWVAMQARADAAEQRAVEREQAARRAELEDRAEARRHNWMVSQYQRAVAEGVEGVDPSRPETYLLDPDQIATRVFAEQDRQTAREEFRAKVQAGEIHVLNVTAAEMTPAAAAEAEELGDAWLGRAKEKSRHAAIVARIKRGMLGKVGF